MNEIEALKQEIMINGSNLSDFGFYPSKTGYTMDGFGVYDSVCKQFDNYILHYGIGIIIIWIVVSWVEYWFFNYGWKKIIYPDRKNEVVEKFKLDFRKEENRIHWYFFINDKMMKMAVGYIAVVIYLLYAR